MKITKNFSFWEFGPKGCDRRWTPDNEQQRHLIEDLAKNLQVLRDKARGSTSIHITSGIRTPADFYRLQGAGYHPSATSDHFCGVAVPIGHDNPKHAKFGDTYNLSVGAGDCHIVGMSTLAFAKMAMEEYRSSNVDFGQIIYERDPIRKCEWVHVSNAYRNYFSSRIVNWLDKTPFLQSLDGGKTYTVATGVQK